MSGPVHFTAEGLAQEALRMQQKLSAGIDTLRNVDEVDYGATARQSSGRRRQMLADENSLR